MILVGVSIWIWTQVCLTPKPRVRLLSIVKLPWRKLKSYIPENKSQVSLDLGSLCTSGTEWQAGPHQWLEGPFSPPNESQGQQVVACFVQVGLRFPGGGGLSHLELHSARQSGVRGYRGTRAVHAWNPLLPLRPKVTFLVLRSVLGAGPFTEEMLYVNELSDNQYQTHFNPLGLQQMTTVSLTHVMLGRREIRVAALTWGMQQLPHLLQKTRSSSKSRELLGHIYCVLRALQT